MRHTRLPATLLVALSLTAMGGMPAALAQDSPVTLRFAVSDAQGRPSQGAVEAFVAEVAKRSGGSVTIEPVYEAGNDTPEGFEQGVAGLVERGDADLGLAASRAWDLAGVTSLQALQAPFLITNDALAASVASGPIAADLLAGMADAGVTGLALWPEDLRHPFSFVPDKPLVAPADFAGATILVQPSALSRALVTALGATVFADDMDRGEAVDKGLLQGAESGLLQGQSLPGTPTATGDVVFYPKFQVLVANSATLGRLSADQRAAIADAAVATRDGAIAGHSSEADAAAAWCAAGGRVVLAGPQGIAAFEAAARPVFDRIAADPVTAAAIAAIRQLATTVEPSAGAVACGPAVPEPSSTPRAMGSPATLPPDGTWRVALTKEEMIAAGARQENSGDAVFTWTFEGGHGHYEASWSDGVVEQCDADRRPGAHRLPVWARLRQRDRLHRMDPGRCRSPSVPGRDREHRRCGLQPRLP
jgi:TRAP-type C4-dicarboxylate transport system substrate-binding protein